MSSALFVAARAASPIARANDALPPPAELPPNHAIELLLRLDPGAPTAEDLVEYSVRPDGAPPLDAFAAIPPESIIYAMPIRAEGDFREWLDANPESPRARAAGALSDRALRRADRSAPRARSLARGALRRVGAGADSAAFQLRRADGVRRRRAARRTIQGYIYAPCTPEATCKPPGTDRLLRKCTPVSERDCATFLQGESGNFSGYTATYPDATSLLGYAYPATDTDGDGLPDGFERVVGTSPTMANSDGDASPDASELPMVGVPVSDPCSGMTGALNCPGEQIFANGFEI